MGDMSKEGSHLAAGIDLSQFFQVFFEEAGENLETHGADAAGAGRRATPTTKS